MEHLVGYLTIGAMLLLSGGMLGWGWLSWRARWGVAAYGDVLVRFDYCAGVSVDLGRRLTEANLAIREAIKESWPDRSDLLEYRVEVVTPGNVRTPSVPNGKLPDGNMVGGSIRSERCLSVGRRHWVAVVIDEQTDQYLVHEVLAHIVPARLTGNPYTHDTAGHYFDPAVKELEYRVKAKLRI